jgi:hypothetical protein
MEEQFINPGEETGCLKKIRKLQYKGDILDFIVRM